MSLKLARKLITGNTYVDDATSGIFPIQTYTGSVPAGYEDVSNITWWDKYFEYTDGSSIYESPHKDWKFIRNEILTLVVTTAGPTFANWSGITASEQKIAARYVTCPIDKVIEQYGADTPLILDEYDKHATKSREIRYKAVRMYVFSKMDLTDAKNILKDAGPTVDLYIGGIEGTVEDGGIDGIFDYVEARTQSSYYTTGFATQSYVPTDTDLTQQDVVDGIMDILKNGNY